MQLFHGTRNDLKQGDLIEPDGSHVSLTPNLDAAIWEAELATGEKVPRVYIVEPLGPTEESTDKFPGRPWMSWRTTKPLRVIGEFTEWRLFHGTRAALKPGDLIKPGHGANYGKKLSWVYFARTIDAAAWGAELAIGEGPGRIYIVEPTGPIEDDPNVTNKRFRGNPTKSFRSREPVRVIGELSEWQGHSPEAIKAMKDGISRMQQLGTNTIED